MCSKDAWVMADAGPGHHVDDGVEAEGNDTEQSRQPLRSITSQVGTVDSFAFFLFISHGINLTFVSTSWNSTVYLFDLMLSLCLYVL